MTPEKKSYFATVLIANGRFGPANEDDIIKAGGHFHCGRCSTADHKVYHNVIGNHSHVDETVLLRWIEEAPEPDSKH